MAPIRVLCVDDETALLDVVKLFLERSGDMLVDTASSAAEAERSVAGDRYDAVVSDYQMPGADGLELLKRLRSRGDRIPFILFTGRGREEVAMEALNNGADFYLQKGGHPAVQFGELEHYIKQGVQRYRAERAQRESEDHFRSLVENLFEGIGVHINGMLVETNHAFCEITGYTKDEVIGKSITELFTPETMEVMSEKLKLPVAQPYDAVVVRKDGRTVKVKTRGKDISWNGMTARLGTIIDLSERSVEGERGEDDVLRAIVEASPDMVWEVDPRGVFTFVSPRITDTLGYSPDEIVGKPIFALTADESTNVARTTLLSHVLDPDKPVHLEVDSRHKDGRPLKIEIFSVAFRGPDGRHAGFRGIARDVTGTTMRDRETKEKSALLAAVLESSPDVIVFALDHDYRYMAYNKRHADTMKQIWGREIAVGSRMLDLIGLDDDRARAKAHFDLALSGGTFAVTEKYGDERLDRLSWQDYYSPIRSPEGTIIGMTCYCLNVTEQERIKDQIEDANKKLRIITSITRHDMLNKLVALSAYFELERRRTADPRLLDSLDRMTRITDTLVNQIDFTKAYQDIGMLSPEWQSVAEVCRQAQTQLDAGQVAVRIDADGMEVLADPMLKKVFYNLMDNSIKHGGHVSEIGVSCWQTERGLSIIYQDNGRGIDAPAKRALFMERPGKTHGLGLFLIREILKITDITIEENGGPGQGVRFEIQVPPGKFRSRRGLG